MSQDAEGKYRSPRYKLVMFFERSRDNWKRKTKEAKLKIKRLSTNLAATRESRQMWRERATQASKRIAELEQELEIQKAG